MMFSSKKKGVHSPECMALHVVVMLLLLFVAIASSVGVYMAHVTAQGLVFGAPAGSLAILAFVGSVLAFVKALKCCMAPCEVCSMPHKK